MNRPRMLRGEAGAYVLHLYCRYSRNQTSAPTCRSAYPYEEFSGPSRTAAKGNAHDRGWRARGDGWACSDCAKRDGRATQW